MRTNQNIEEPESGFTLIELMVTLGIAAIFLSQAIPGFQSLIMSHRQVVRVNLLVGTLSVARSEAVKRAGRVVVCPSSDGVTCTESTQWKVGWIVFADDDNSGTRGEVDSQMEELIRVHEGFPTEKVSFLGAGTIQSYVSFTAVGTIRKTDGGLQNGTFTYCNEQGIKHATVISINIMGQASTSKGAAECLL